MKNILKEIEAKYPVDTILVNGEQAWPYLRISYHFNHVQRIAAKSGEKELSPSLLRRVLGMIKNSLYGITSWFGKYDYIVLSDTTERKNINGQYFNKLLDPIIDKLGRDKVLYMELPAPSLYPIKKVHTKNVACLDLLTLLSVTCEILLPKKYVIQNESILKTIQEEYDLKVDYRRRIKIFNAQKRGFNLLFRRLSPRQYY